MQIKIAAALIITLWSSPSGFACTLTNLSMRCTPQAQNVQTSAQNELLVTIERGRQKLQVWSQDVSMPDDWNGNSDEYAQAVLYRTLALSMDAEALSRDHWAFDTPASRQLYLDRLCRLCAAEKNCGVTQVTWDPLADTAAARARAVQTADPALFEFYETFDHQGGDAKSLDPQGGWWRLWSSMVYEDGAAGFLQECKSRNFSQLEGISRLAQREYAWDQALDATQDDPTLFTRLLYEKYIQPATYRWAPAAKHVGLDFIPQQNWLRGHVNSLDSLDLDAVLQILVSQP